jgi:hypothetical protein
MICSVKASFYFELCCLDRRELTLEVSNWNRTYGDWRNTETGWDQHAAVKEGAVTG